MTGTVPDLKLEQPGVGYWVGAYLDPDAAAKVDELRNSIRSQLPEGLLWSTPSNALHTTLFEPVMLYRDYDSDKDKWFKEHETGIIQTTKEVLKGVGPITVRFNVLEASESAILVRYDGYENENPFQDIREQIDGANIIMPGSRKPPGIIHSSLFRYLKVADLERVKDVVDSHKIDFTTVISEFCLERVSIVPIGGITRIAVFPLGQE